MAVASVKNLLKSQQRFPLAAALQARTMRGHMGLKRRITGGILTIVGFMLSPLSWWNDAFVNLPLAVGFAWLVSLLATKSWKETVFDVSVIVGYWLTNVLGLVLMHKGAKQLIDREAAGGSLKKDLLVSLLYTALIVLFIKCGILKPIEGYFSRS